MIHHNKKYLEHKYEHTKWQYGGAEVLYHGTSLYYIDSIIKNGLNRFYPDDLLRDIHYVCEIIRVMYPENEQNVYTSWFNESKTELRKKMLAIVSLTGSLSVAKEFAEKERYLGEGPDFIINELYKLIEYKNDELMQKLPILKQSGIINNEQETLKKLKQIYDKFSIAKKYPGVILAVKYNDIKNYVPKNEMEEKAHILLKNGFKQADKQTYEVISYMNIPSEFLYIYNESNGEFIKLISSDGKQYMDNLMSNVNEELNLLKLEQKKDVRIFENNNYVRFMFRDGRTINMEKNKRWQLNTDDISLFKFKETGENITSEIIPNFTFNVQRSDPIFV